MRPRRYVDLRPASRLDERAGPIARNARRSSNAVLSITVVCSGKVEARRCADPTALAPDDVARIGFLFRDDKQCELIRNTDLRPDFKVQGRHLKHCGSHKK